MTFRSPPLLSICIPSYNRDALLGELLERVSSSLVGELTDVVEVIVSDNASSDQTQAVATRFESRIPRFSYIRQSENIGSDRNFLACVAKASGTFAWLMGDDDVPEPGGIARIVQVLCDHPHIAGMTVDRFARSFDLATRRSEDALARFRETTILNGADEVFTRLTEYIAFMSAQVFNRNLWMEVAAKEPVEEFLNAYIHMYIFANILKRNPQWIVLKERLVTWRADNDSFLGAGRYRRIEIDVVGYEQIARACFGEGSATYLTIRDTIATQNLRMMVTSSRIEGSWTGETRRRTIKLALSHYAKSPKFWLVTAPILFAPASVLPVLKWAQRLVHARRARRIGMVSNQRA